jgi:hypothetical protein
MQPNPREEARAVAYEQMAWWINQGIAVGEAYEAVTGRRGYYATWQTVEHELIQWWLRQKLPAFKRGPLPPARRAA